MAAQKTSYSILFADVSGSSKLYKEIGNASAKAAIDQAIAMMKEVTEEENGKVIKTIGDEVMSCFKQCNEAVSAAQKMQRRCRTRTGGNPIKLRIGIDFGEVIVENNDLFGNAVNNASYVSHVARGGQVVISENVLNNLNEELYLECHEFDRITLKGGASTDSVYLLHWEEAERTAFHERTIAADLPDSLHLMGKEVLHIEYLNQRVTIKAGNTPFSIGRSQSKAGLCLQAKLASREHCQILYRRGKFILADNSTNGTYVSFVGGKEIYLRREELPLAEKGTLSIGQPQSADEQSTIRYFIDRG